MKQQQSRPKTRAPHGTPEFTERIAFYCTADQKKKFKKSGGSQYMRKILTEA